MAAAAEKKTVKITLPKGEIPDTKTMTLKVGPNTDLEAFKRRILSKIWESKNNPALKPPSAPEYSLQDGDKPLKDGDIYKQLLIDAEKGFASLTLVHDLNFYPPFFQKPGTTHVTVIHEELALKLNLGVDPKWTISQLKALICYKFNRNGISTNHNIFRIAHIDLLAASRDDRPLAHLTDKLLDAMENDDLALKQLRMVNPKVFYIRFCCPRSSIIVPDKIVPNGLDSHEDDQPPPPPGLEYHNSQNVIPPPKGKEDVGAGGKKMKELDAKSKFHLAKTRTLGKEAPASAAPAAPAAPPSKGVEIDLDAAPPPPPAFEAAPRKFKAKDEPLVPAAAFVKGEDYKELYGIQEKFRATDYDKTKCSKCYQFVGGHHCTKAAGAIWHTECFTCRYCDKPITESKFPRADATSFCNKKCVDRAIEEGILRVAGCHKCGKTLQDGAVLIGAARYHPTCWVCSGCKKKLGDEYAELNSKFYCAACAEKRM